MKTNSIRDRKRGEARQMPKDLTPDQPSIPPTIAVVSQVALERQRQDAKWGQMNHPIVNPRYPSGILSAKMAREMCDARHSCGVGSWMDILVEELAEVLESTTPEEQRNELIQLAAVAVAAVECIDRAQDKAAQKERTQ